MSTNQYGRHGAPSHAAPVQPRNAARSASGSAPIAPGAQRLGTIRAGQGARVTTRENAAEAADLARANAERRHRKRRTSPQLTARANSARRDGGHAPSHASHSMPEGPERNGRNILKVVGLAILVLVVVLLLGRCAAGLLTSKSESTDQQVSQSEGQQPTQAEQIATEQQQVEVSVGEAVTYQGQSYSIQQDGGSYSVQRDGTVLFNLEGTPTALILYNGTLVIPENRDGGWDVVCYMMADGSVPSYVMGSDGNAVGGSGSVQSATLDGDALKVVDSAGTTTSVALS